MEQLEQLWKFYLVKEKEPSLSSEVRPSEPSLGTHMQHALIHTSTGTQRHPVKTLTRLVKTFFKGPLAHRYGITHGQSNYRETSWDLRGFKSEN